MACQNIAAMQAALKANTICEVSATFPLVSGQIRTKKPLQ